MQPVVPKLQQQIYDLRCRLPRRFVAARPLFHGIRLDLDNELNDLIMELQKLSERQIDRALEQLEVFQVILLQNSMFLLNRRIERTRPSWMKGVLKWWHRVKLDHLKFIMDELKGMTEELVKERNRIPKPLVVRYLPPPPEMPFDSTPSPDWLAMFVPSETPSICIGDDHACCQICLEEFEPPSLYEEGADSEELNQMSQFEEFSPDILMQLPCQHVLHPVVPKLQQQIYDLRRRLPRRFVAARPLFHGIRLDLDDELNDLIMELQKLSERQIDRALELLEIFQVILLQNPMFLLNRRIERTRPSRMKGVLKWWHRVKLDHLKFVMDELKGMTEELVKERNRIPKPLVVRYLPPLPDGPFTRSPSPDWLAMFVPSETPSVCIEDHNACCQICLEDFEPPRLSEEGVDSEEMNQMSQLEESSSDILMQLPCQHVLHAKCLRSLEETVCPMCRCQFLWQSRTIPPSRTTSPIAAVISSSASSIPNTDDNDDRGTNEDHTSSTSPIEDDE
ncbi:hypothetical protein D9758_012732 [Tetrapyrgos nigripes]|uniref:RING-type domain-containing protein n=1 Tax=Tetrapyrgos nigripes TaxID=182062 RepID=A0A8H5CX45_9AGAR|nr:hypothetical protein D9758_012732 [Tetrapyrgos nigripes]